ncbi:Rab9 effector protein with kelch motifs [Varanus komodoensis]|nr:Rab9 effector protein with kelch motifs [Varanus komodoensis]
MGTARLATVVTACAMTHRALLCIDASWCAADTHGWTAPTWSGLSPRYEHATFIPESQPTTLWVYGGASETGNRNCVQVLDLRTGTWESPEVTGTPPSPRTFHTSSAAIGDRLYVFGGGEKGVDPVLDQKLHVFDSGARSGWKRGRGLLQRAYSGREEPNSCTNSSPMLATLSWSQPQVRGRPPAARHGHVMVAVQNRLFLHGGLAGSTLYDDLFSIDTTDMEWVAMAATGSVPQGRAAHSAAAFRDHLYIFGGMDPTGALDTMYKYHIEKNHWTRVEFKSPSPPGRLDHSMCVIPWKVSAGSATAGGAQGQKEATGSSSGGCPEEGLLHLCLIFGGMSMKGEIYRDVAVSLLV